MFEWIKKFLLPRKPPDELAAPYLTPCRYSRYGYANSEYGCEGYVRYLEENIVEHMWIDILNMKYYSRYVGTSNCGKEFHMRSVPSPYIEHIVWFGEEVARPLIQAELNFMNKYGAPMTREQK